MILNYTPSDDDFLFLFHRFNPNIQFIKSQQLSLVTETETCLNEVDLIIEALFELAKEEFTTKKLAEFKKYRKAPVNNLTDKITVVSLLNYINLVKEAIITGSLKNKDYIFSFTELVKPRFDPEFNLFEVRLGLIKNIYEAPEMDKLFCEEVIANKEYFICSGLRQVYKKEDLAEKKFLFLLNIKKVKFKSLESHGMICCAGEKAEAIEIKEGEVGGRIYLESHLPIFEDLEYGKVDFTKSSYKNGFGHFKVINHYLTYKGIKVLYDGKYVMTECAEGEVK